MQLEQILLSHLKTSNTIPHDIPQKILECLSNNENILDAAFYHFLLKWNLGRYTDEEREDYVLKKTKAHYNKDVLAIVIPKYKELLMKVFDEKKTEYENFKANMSALEQFMKFIESKMDSNRNKKLYKGYIHTVGREFAKLLLAKAAKCGDVDNHLEPYVDDACDFLICCKKYGLLDPVLMYYEMNEDNHKVIEKIRLKFIHNKLDLDTLIKSQSMPKSDHAPGSRHVLFNHEPERCTETEKNSSQDFYSVPSSSR